MPDPAVSAVLAEAHASAPEGLVVCETLELWHPAFSTALRIVADNGALEARLEPDAPREAGAVVTFIPLGFRLRPPETLADAPGVLEAEIDSAGREIVAEIDAAVASLAPVEVIWRRFIADEALDGPEYVARGLTVRSVSATPLRPSAQAGWQDLVNERFPTLEAEAGARRPTPPGPPTGTATGTPTGSGAGSAAPGCRAPATAGRSRARSGRRSSAAPCRRCRWTRPTCAPVPARWPPARATGCPPTRRPRATAC